MDNKQLIESLQYCIHKLDEEESSRYYLLQHIKKHDREICKELYPILIKKDFKTYHHWEIVDVLLKYGYKFPRDHILANRWIRFGKVLSYLYLEGQIPNWEFQLANKLRYYLATKQVDKAYELIKSYNPRGTSYYAKLQEKYIDFCDKNKLDIVTEVDKYRKE